jgi:hypothetical protein
VPLTINKDSTKESRKKKGFNFLKLPQYTPIFFFGDYFGDYFLTLCTLEGNLITVGSNASLPFAFILFIALFIV